MRSPGDSATTALPGPLLPGPLLPGPLLPGPLALSFGATTWRSYTTALWQDGDSRPVAAVAADSRWGQRRAETAGASLDLARRKGRTCAAEPVSGELALVVERGRILVAGGAYGFARPWRLGRRPWLLSAGEVELARFQPHICSIRRRVRVQLSGARPVPALLVLAACSAIVATQNEHAPPAGAP